MLTFHHVRNGKPASVARVTNGGLGCQYGPDRGRALVVSLEPGDLIVFRPKGTRHKIALSVFDAYRYAVRCSADAEAREKRQNRAAKWKGQAP